MSQLKSIIFHFALLLVPFVIDLFIELGVAVGTLYVFGLIVLIKSSKKSILIHSVFASILTLAVMWLDGNGLSWMVYSNRIISVISIWAVAIILLKYGIREEKGELVSQLNTNRKEVNSLKQFILNDIGLPMETNHQELCNLQLSLPEWNEKIDPIVKTSERILQAISFVRDKFKM